MIYYIYEHIHAHMHKEHKKDIKNLFTLVLYLYIFCIL